MHYLFDDFLSLLFPESCQGCGIALVRGEELICIKCLHDLPYTDYHLDPNNRVARQFWGRTELRSAMALLYFRQGGLVQQLLHRLKYGNKPDLAVLMGKLLGARLLLSKTFIAPDIVVHVPMHGAAERKRGYNQGEKIAQGVAECTGWSHMPHILRKTRHTASQTKRSRFSRYENMRSVFTWSGGQIVSAKNILIVDDVITTGATLEACALALNNAGAASVSIAALAFTE